MVFILERWKIIIKKNYENNTSFSIHGHLLSKGPRVTTSDKPTEIYYILISKVQNKPSSNIYFENLFNEY